MQSNIIMEHAYLKDVFPNFGQIKQPRRIYQESSEEEKSIREYEQEQQLKEQRDQEQRDQEQREIMQLKKQIDFIKNIQAYKKLRFIDNCFEYENRFFRRNDSRWTFIQNINQLVKDSIKLNIDYHEIFLGITIMKNTTYKNDKKWIEYVDQHFLHTSDNDNDNDNSPPSYQLSNQLLKKL